MATLDQIISELNTTYNPQIQSIQQRQAAIPGQQQAEEAGLEATKNNAFGDIINQARRRGTGVALGGLPVAEEQKYTASQYLPALARLKQSGKEQQMSLQDALNQIYEKRNAFAYQIKQNDDQLQESRRQFDTNMAFQREQEAARLRAAAASNASSFSPTISGGGAAPGSAPVKGGAPATPNYVGNNDLRGHLAYAAQKEGNRNAEVALKYVGNDGFFYLDPRTTSPALINILQGLGAKNKFQGAANGSVGSSVGIAGQKLNFGF